MITSEILHSLADFITDTNWTPNGGYRNQFWIEDFDRPGFMARGVFSQLIYVDPGDDMVVVKLASWPEFTSVPRLKTALNAIHALGKFLHGSTSGK